MKSIGINTELIEMMIFFWTSVAEREKVAEQYIISVAERPEMKYIYDEEFDEQGFRKVLSAISNRELINGGTQKEKRFWNNNMWMLEDLSVMEAMVEPIKKLNLESMASELNTASDLDEIELIFVPGTTEEYIVKGNKIIVNFFKINVDIFGGTGEVSMFGKPFKDAVADIIAKA